MYNEYELQLSPFGRKVLISLLKIKEERRNNFLKPIYPPPVPRYQNRQILRFNNFSPPKSQPLSSDKVEEITSIEQNINNVGDERFETDIIQHASTSFDLLISEQFKSTITTDELVHLTEQIPSPNKVTDDTIDVELVFDQMFDIDDIFKCVDDHNNDGNKLHADVPHNAVSKTDTNEISETTEIIPKDTIKRKNVRNSEGSGKKRNKINDNETGKKSYRKKKYTTTVRNWLKEVQPLHNENEGGEGGGEEKHEQGKKKREMVQSRLQNKGGVMRYGRGKEKDEHTHEQQVTEDQLKKATKKVVSEKKSKKKFVAPLKSQVPVKDITYPIQIYEDAGCKEFENADLVNKEVFMTLIFSNGSCQLNSSHTVTGSVEGLILCIDETFYYFKGPNSVTDALGRTLSSNQLICYDAKTIIKYLVSLGRDVQLYQFLDVKIAGHLVSLSQCPETFSELCERVSSRPDYTLASECILQRTAWHVTMMKEVWATLNTTMVQDGLYELFVGTEMKVLQILADMEQRGVCVDVERLEAMGEVLKTRMKEVEEECYRAAGRNFQINSATQLRQILYGDLELDQKCNITVRKTSAKGDKSTSEDVLRSLMSVHPLPGLILEYRHLHKAHSTFITGIAHHVVDGVVKPTWDQTAAVTGRISSSNPNLQAIPKTFNLVLFPQDDADPVSLSFRSVYRGRAGWRLVVADFKQVECRVLAHAAQDEQLEQALTSDDLFIDLAARWLEKPVEEVSGKDRERTKRLVYAGLYGAGAKTMADILQLPHGQLEDLIRSFDRTFPSLKRFCKGVWSECSRDGRVSTVGGRTRTFPNISSEDGSLRAQAQRQAVNFIIQGSAAELCKRSMCECVCVVRRARVEAHLLLAVHDELVWQVAEEHVPRAAGQILIYCEPRSIYTLHVTHFVDITKLREEIIKSCMEGCGRQLGLRVPLPVALYTGSSWGELEEYTHAGDREEMGQGHG
ncbi:unnamed protein product [Danaus chrysippus]|uniref:(African queen) hypothetical protein n=1 Tax=Danaus chrysippus TaxID=151541 RepID=A0A8J2R457_9NEOP|nr:unnamed protein product [Danaus chrysippus]